MLTYFYCFLFFLSSNALRSPGTLNAQLEEDEDVYEEMDEEAYAAHVESRRNQEDFVVDDNGNGYADNGEEWIGATEDERERKKRKMRDSGADDDKKLTKNARKIAEAGRAQHGQMRNFARAGVSEANKKTAAASMQRADDVDIDDLLGVNPRAKKSGVVPRLVRPTNPSSVFQRPRVCMATTSSDSVFTTLWCRHP